MFCRSLKLDVVICTSLCSLLRVWEGGGAYFIVHVTSNIVVLFLVRNGAVLFFSSKPYIFLMIIPVVDCTETSCSYNVESSIVEYRRTCTSVCYRASLDIFTLGAERHKNFAGYLVSRKHPV